MKLFSFVSLNNMLGQLFLPQAWGLWCQPGDGPGQRRVCTWSGLCRHGVTSQEGPECPHLTHWN